MKKFYITFALGLLLTGSLLAQTQQAQPTQASSFTLQQCIDYAIENNPNMNNARGGVKSAEAKVRETTSAGLPQVTASADLANNFIIPTSFLPAQIVDKNAPAGTYIGVQFGTRYVGRATLNLDQMIFNGSYFVGLKASKTFTELSRKDLVRTQTDLVSLIKKAYYSVLVSKERYALVEKNYARLDSLLNQTKAMYENGVAEKIDVSRIQVQVNNMLATLGTTAVVMQVSSDLLKYQMGLPISDQIILTDNLETIKLQILNDDVKKDFSYSNRIEYSMWEVNSALAELNIKNTKAGYLPRLDFYGNYGASYGTASYGSFVSFGTNWRTLGVFGLRANMPIFDGLRKSSQIQQQRITLMQSENSKRLTKNAIDMEQDQYSLLFNTSVATVRMQRENMALAEDVYNVTVIKYQQGVGSNIEVINADASYKEAQTNYYAALYDALIASVDLEKAYGKLLDKN